VALMLLVSLTTTILHVRAQQSDRSSSQPSKPHIVFIVLDDLGSNDLGFHGSGILTPNVDGLITDGGLLLDNYYTLRSCTQTRIAFMTGKYPYRNGIYDVVRPQDTYGMEVSDTTLAQTLKDGAGYATHAVGKVSSWKVGRLSRELRENRSDDHIVVPACTPQQNPAVSKKVASWQCNVRTNADVPRLPIVHGVLRSRPVRLFQPHDN